LTDHFKKRNVNPEDGDGSRTHGTESCKKGECCDVLKAKLEKWVLHALQRGYETFTDKNNLWGDPSKATQLQNHLDKLKEAIDNMGKCFTLAVEKCTDEKKPGPPLPPPIFCRDPSTRTYPIPVPPPEPFPIVIDWRPIARVVPRLAPALLRLPFIFFLVPSYIDPSTWVSPPSSNLFGGGAEA
jgi:hypothetical protein